MTYLDVWRSGTFLLYSCKAAFWIQETSLRLCDVEHSVVLRSVFAIGSAIAYLRFFRQCATPPHVQVRHTTWLSFTRPSPALVLQATNAGARRPGNEATPNARTYVITLCIMPAPNPTPTTPTNFRIAQELQFQHADCVQTRYIKNVLQSCMHLLSSATHTGHRVEPPWADTPRSGRTP